MAEEIKTFDLELICDLQQAANFYKVEIDEIEIREYSTPFTLTEKDTSSSITISCKGCNELIGINVIELPRISNFLSTRYIFPILVIVGLFFLPFIEINISEITSYLISLTFWLFFANMYSFIFKPPTELDTLFFWHKIATAE